MKPFFTEADCDSLDNGAPCLSIDEANQLLEERGKVVFGQWDRIADHWHFNDEKIDYHTHKALIICIEPIEQDSAEKILREILGGTKSAEEWCNWTERAKAILEREGK